MGKRVTTAPQIIRRNAVVTYNRTVERTANSAELEFPDRRAPPTPRGQSAGAGARLTTSTSLNS